MNETHLFSSYTRSLFQGWNQFDKSARRIGIKTIMCDEEYLALIREFVLCIFERVQKTKPAASILLEKTPDHVKYWQDILAVLPEAHFIHLIRDPRAVVASLSAANRSWGSDWASPKILDNCAKWLTYVEAGREIVKNTPNYLEVRFEELKENGPRTLQSTLAWCGVDMSLETAQEIVANYSIERLRLGAAEGTAWPISSEPNGFFRNGSTDGWKLELKRRQIALVELMARELMAALGYVPTTVSSPFCRWNAAIQLILMERLRNASVATLRRLGKRLIPAEI